jgi:hypothetical protein
MEDLVHEFGHCCVSSLCTYRLKLGTARDETGKARLCGSESTAQRSEKLINCTFSECN